MEALKNKVSDKKASESALPKASDVVVAEDGQRAQEELEFNRIGEPKSTLAFVSPRSRRTVALLTADIVALICSFTFAYLASNAYRAISTGSAQPVAGSASELALLMFVVPSILTVSLLANWGHYVRFRPVWTELRDIVKVTAYVCVADVLLLFVFKHTFSRLWIGFFAVFLVVFLPTGRYLSRRAMMKLGWWLKSTYVVGTGSNAMMTAVALESDIALGHRVDGFVDLSAKLGSEASIFGKRVFNDLPRLVADSEQEHPCVVFAFESLSEMNKHRAVVNHNIAMSPYSTIAPPINGLPLYGAEILTVFKQDAVLLKLQNNINKRGSRLVKQLFDAAICLPAVVLLSPLFFVIGFLIRRDGEAATYEHERIGRAGKRFGCLKFRTMVVNGDEVLSKHLSENAQARSEWLACRKITDDPRVTPIGKFLRKTSLDELPQLINVLRGEMSLVGPRPIVEDEIERYGDSYPYYQSMTPGITGLWQTSGRSDTTYNERVMLDVWYARNWSLWHDIVILIRTIPSLLMQKGAR